MKFKTKQVEILAWREGCGEPMPQILADMSVSGDIKLPCTIGDIDKKILFSKGNVYNKIHNSWIEFTNTDWLIYSNGPDDIYPCVDEQFQKKYEPI